MAQLIVQVVLQQFPDSFGDGARQPSVEERLHRIEKIREQGTINQQEFEEYRKEILKGL